MKFLVEFAKFMNVEIEAETSEEAYEKAKNLDDDYIELSGKNYNDLGYTAWNIKPLN